jgi:hypothetical protein
MIDPLFWYLVSMIVAATGLGLVLLLGFLTARERDRLPEACRYTRLNDMISEAEKQLRHSREAADQMATELAAARQLVEEGKHWRQWLEDNQTLLQTVRSERQQQQELQQLLLQLSEAVEREKKRRDDLTLESQGLKADADLIRVQLEGAKSDLVRATQELQEVRRELQQSAARRDEAGKAASEAEARCAGAKASCETVLADLQRLTERLDTVVKALRETEARHRELDAQCAGLLAKKGEIESQIAGAKREFERFRESEERRRKEFEQQTSASIADLKSQRDRIVASIEKDIEDAKRRGLAHGVAAGELKLADRLSDVWTPVIPAASLTKSLPERSEQDRLAYVRQYLAEHGLRFHSRIVNAFHTSLKVANDSPLVVLAGISGTGKSLLPKRYAEAMGIHLLTVPVQPRWDSPQDLLGFFNHLQGKYIPTDLLRALIQMERHWQNRGRNWPEPGKAFQNRKDQMMLVLLDEMNLARIEYYFSDFLSVLENRRDISNFDDVTQRRKGEVALDVGPTGTEIQDFRLYVDRNVLFVGTMNEDESTQTLSDKVVDRANVLRFAPPRTFDRLGDATDAPDAESGHLKFKTWEGWIENGSGSLSEDHQGRLQGWVKQLAEALKKVGRPFGHRVNRSIHAYVSQYPDRSEQGIKNAVADQVEQRILPKLRGVDLSLEAAKSAVTDVLRVVTALGDEPLQQAIRGGDTGQQFLWMGVDRGGDDTA